MASLQKLAVFVCLLGATYAYVNGKITCKETWEDVTNAIKQGSKEEFIQHVGPLAKMAKTAYNAKIDEEIPEWQVVQEFKMITGLYALAYKSETNPNKLVLAFRGIRVEPDNTGEMEQDLCARSTLMEAGLKCREDKIKLPESCKGMAEWKVHYLNQARVFIAQLRAKYPDECFLYTGRSLGASLASILSATSGRHESHAVSFSPTPSEVPQIITNLGIEDFDYSRVITISDKNDGHVDLEDCKYGVLCQFEGPEPESCATCTAETAQKSSFPDLEEVLLNMDSPCGECLRLTHGFGHIYKSVYDLQRPQCYEKGWVQIPYVKEGGTDEDKMAAERSLLDLLLKKLN